MKTFEEYKDDKNEKNEKNEKLFIELAHLDDLVFKFDFIKYPSDLFYFYRNIYLFDQDKKNTHFFINHNDIWVKFDGVSGKYDYKHIMYFMSKMIDKYFNIKDYDIDSEEVSFTEEVHINFNI